ncbi:MAG: glycosyltransferase family 39 protein [Verrucomicrobiales bacterium]|nr:glycosyltransferase family 39 protein [Verrucomicrobiales bacterium]
MPLLFGGFVLTTVFEKGRWARDLEYDDLNYYLEGYEYAEQIRNKGISGAVEQFTTVPLRAPFSVFIATVGFLIFGYQEWAPLVINLIVVSGFAAAAFLFFPWRFQWQGVLAAIAVLFTPTVFEAANQFRPDFAYGLVISLACALLFRMLAEKRDDLSWWAGVAIGGAFVVKTSTLPLTIVMIGSTAVLGLMAAGWRFRGGKEILQQKLRALLKLTFCALLVALPLYLFNGKIIVHYIWKVVFDEAESAIWRTELNLMDRLTAYLTGHWAWHTALPHLWGWLGLTFLGILLTHLGLSGRQAKWRMIHWGSMILVAYAVVTYNAEKTSFLGLPFFIVSMMASLEAASIILSVGRQRVLCSMPVLVFFLVGIYCFKPSQISPTWYEPGDESGERWKRANRRLVEIVSRTPGESSLFIASPGTFDAAQISWVALKENKLVHAYDDRRLDSLDSAIPLINVADYVVSCPEDSLFSDPRFPTDFLADEIYAYLRNSYRFEEIEVIEAVAGYPYYLFRQKDVFHVNWGEGFYEPERDGASEWRWSEQSSFLEIQNISGEELSVLISLTVQLPEQSRVQLSWGDHEKSIELGEEWFVETNLGAVTIPAADSVKIHFEFAGNPFESVEDSRDLYFRLIQFKIDDLRVMNERRGGF